MQACPFPPAFIYSSCSCLREPQGVNVEAIVHWTFANILGGAVAAHGHTNITWHLDIWGEYRTLERRNMLLLLEILVWKFLLFIRPAQSLQSNQAKKLGFPKYSNQASTAKVNLDPELSRYDCVMKVHGHVTKHTQVAIVTILLGESVFVLAARVIH
jgi:hypothetical protein